MSTTTKAEHTPEPWATESGYVWADDHRMMVAELRGWGRLTGTGGGLGLCERDAIAVQDANARRIVAAVNACAGIPTEALEGGIVGELLSIVRRFIALPGGAWHPDRYARDKERLESDALAAVAKAEGRNHD